MRLLLLSLAGLAASALAQDAPPIQSSFVAKPWFMEHLSGWESAKIEEIKPPARGEWTSGGGLFGSPLLSAGWSPAKEDHITTMHCWRVTAGSPPRTDRYLFVETLSGSLIKVKHSREGKLGKDVARWCGDR